MLLHSSSKWQLGAHHLAFSIVILTCFQSHSRVPRYLVCGADSASLYLRVLDVQGTEVVCEAQNDAVLDGLLTVFHVERSTDTLSNVQNELPLLSDYDKECLAAMGAEYEIDFVSLSYTRTRQDLRDARK